MKSLAIFLGIGTLALFACNQNKPSGNADASAQDSTQVTECYQASVKNDSAFLSYQKIGEKVTGKLSFNFAEKDDSNGDIRGYFNGDTLFVDYVFKAEGKVNSKNPLVFLKSGNNLKQGYGEIVTYLGKTYFKDHSQLKFEEGFLFEPVACE